MTALTCSRIMISNPVTRSANPWKRYSKANLEYGNEEAEFSRAEGSNMSNLDDHESTASRDQCPKAGIQIAVPVRINEARHHC